MITYFKKVVSFSLIAILLMTATFSCVPKEEIVFKGINNISVESDQNNQPVLTADALFYNPNTVRIKLKEIYVDVMVNGKPSAQVRQQFKLSIKAKSDFSVPVTAQLSLKELGLLDTIVNILGGKKYEIQYAGYVRIAVHGVTIKVPFTYKEEIRLRL